MRLRTPLIGLVIPLLLLAAGCSKLENNGLFYYYFNEKIYLTERRDMLFIQFQKGLPEARKQQILESAPSLHPWTYHSRMGWGDNTFDGSGDEVFAVLQSGGRISRNTFNAFRDMDGVESVSYMLGSGDDYLAASDNFAVKLNATTTFNQLEALARQYGCTVYQEEEIDEDIYFVKVPKTVEMGMIRLSCLFHETGLFAFASPDFYNFGGFDV